MAKGSSFGDAVYSLFEKDSFVPVRASAAKALGSLQYAKAVPLLGREAKQINPFGLVCLQALGQIPGDASRKALEALLKPHPYEASRILGERREQASIPALEPLLEQGLLRARLAAAWALARMGNTQGIDFLKFHLKPNRVEDRVLALKASVGVDAAGILELVVAATTNPDPRVRKAAAWALQGKKRPLAAGALRALLTDKEEDVRVAALEAIAISKEVAYQDMLSDALHNGSHAMKIPAIRGLVALGIRDDVELLREWVRSNEVPRELSQEAWIGLKVLTGSAPLLNSSRKGLLEVAKPIQLPSE